MVTAVVEKPPVDEAPSNLAVVGRYVLSEKIWDMLEFTPAWCWNSADYKIVGHPKIVE